MLTSFGCDFYKDGFSITRFCIPSLSPEIRLSDILQTRPNRSMEQIKLKTWKSLDWRDPEEWLIELRKIELILPLSLNPKIRALRTNKLKRYKEGREAALLAMGIKRLYGYPAIEFAHYEDEDYDVVLRYPTKDSIGYTPIQLKELSPDSLPNPRSLSDLLNSLSKYSNLQDLHVAIFLNRETRIGLKSPQDLKMRSLHYFFCISSDQSKWRIVGDCMKPTECCDVDFDYPTSRQAAASDDLIF